MPMTEEERVQYALSGIKYLTEMVLYQNCDKSRKMLWEIIKGVISHKEPILYYVLLKDISHYMKSIGEDDLMAEAAALRDQVKKTSRAVGEANEYLQGFIQSHEGEYDGLMLFLVNSMFQFLSNPYKE